MIRCASLAACLALFWLLLSGMFTPFLVGAGLASALAVAAFSQRMDLVDREGHPIHLAWVALLSYWPWLIKEIAKSGWDVSKRVLHPQLPISPTLRRFIPTQHSELGLVIHANSITLTPGTIAVEVAPDEFLVHALTREGADGLAGSEMDRRCTRLEGRP
jgi:multicomponent Na+:H+ antiporter subunit E